MGKNIFYYVSYTIKEDRMKATELIKMLQERIEKHGDLDCVYQDLFDYSWCDFDVDNIEFDLLDYNKKPVFRVR